MEYQGKAKLLVDLSTEVARMFGEEVVGAVDVVQALADSHAETGIVFAEAGLTESVMIRWRRSTARPPVFSLGLSRANDAVEAALAATNRLGVAALLAPRAVYGAMVAATLLDAGGDPRLTALLRDVDVNLKRLRKSLSKVRRGHPPTPPERRRSASVWEREGRLVFEPARTSELGVGHAVPTRAVVTGPDTTVSDIGALLCRAVSMYGVDDADGVEPFWTGFGARTLEGFMRRARLVMVQQNDASVTLAPTTHTHRTHYLIRSDRTSVRAPVDDLEWIGRATLAAISECRG